MNRSEFRYSTNDGGWVGQLDGWEFLVAGDAAFPDPQHLLLAECVLPELEKLTKQANGYLRQFVKFDRAEWQLDWVEIGWGEADKGEEFELILSIKGCEDDFPSELWGVTFRVGGSRFSPVQFRCRQC